MYNRQKEDQEEDWEYELDIEDDIDEDLTHKHCSNDSIVIQAERFMHQVQSSAVTFNLGKINGITIQGPFCKEHHDRIQKAKLFQKQHKGIKMEKPFFFLTEYDDFQWINIEDCWIYATKQMAIYLAQTKILLTSYQDIPTEGYKNFLWEAMTQKCEDPLKLLNNFKTLTREKQDNVSYTVVPRAMMTLLRNTQSEPKIYKYLLKDFVKSELYMMFSNQVDWEEQRKKSRYSPLQATIECMLTYANEVGKKINERKRLFEENTEYSSGDKRMRTQMKNFSSDNRDILLMFLKNSVNSWLINNKDSPCAFVEFTCFAMTIRKIIEETKWDQISVSEMCNNLFHNFNVLVNNSIFRLEKGEVLKIYDLNFVDYGINHLAENKIVPSSEHMLDLYEEEGSSEEEEMVTNMKKWWPASSYSDSGVEEDKKGILESAKETMETINTELPKFVESISSATQKISKQGEQTIVGAVDQTNKNLEKFTKLTSEISATLKEFLSTTCGSENLINLFQKLLGLIALSAAYIKSKDPAVKMLLVSGGALMFGIPQMLYNLILKLATRVMDFAQNKYIEKMKRLKINTDLPDAKPDIVKEKKASSIFVQEERPAE